MGIVIDRGSSRQGEPGLGGGGKYSTVGVMTELEPWVGLSPEPEPRGEKEWGRGRTRYTRAVLPASFDEWPCGPY